MATAADIASLLGGTSIPAGTVEELLVTPSPLWLASASAEVLAKDLALCHPPLGVNEVRAVAQPLEPGLVRLTVVTRDRHRLLADTAAALASEAISVVAASVMTWEVRELALHALTVRPGNMTKNRWDELGARLRTVGAGAPIDVDFTPVGRPDVSSTSVSEDRLLLSVNADDQVGLLWAICQWLADERVEIESAQIGASDGRADDRFLVHGPFDPERLRAHLSPPTRNLFGAFVAKKRRLVARRSWPFAGK